MTKRSASHLRIHQENTAERNSDSCPSPDEVTACLDAFTRATGWAIQPQGHALTKPSSDLARGVGSVDSRQRKWRLVESFPIDSITDAEDLLALPTTGLMEAEQLLESIHQLASRLEQAEQTIRRQEAELATHVGVSVKCEEDLAIADRLESVLASSTQAIDASASAIYLLDDATSSLKMRSNFGLPISKLAEPARELRGSLADLEALLGNAVMLEDISLIPEWNSPEPFGSALCVPIGSPSMPHGTLWYWGLEPRKFTSAQVEVANLAAGRIMSELERGILASDVQAYRIVQRQLDCAGLAQASRLPDSQPLHRSFEVEGWTFQDGSLGGAFHDWDMSPNELILLGLGHANRTGPEGAIIATACQSAMRAHWRQNSNLGATMRFINDSLWGSCDADWTSSLSLFQINPKTGHGSMACAGTGQAFIISHRGFRPIGQSGPYLAKQPDPHYSIQRFVLQPGEVLVIFSDSIIQSKAKASAKRKSASCPARSGTSGCGISQDDLLQSVRSLLDESASHIAGHLARMLPATIDPLNAGLDRSMIVVRNITKV